MEPQTGQPQQSLDRSRALEPDTKLKPHAKAACSICPHSCLLAEGQLGACRGRICKAGKVQAENYGRITALALDPIEKKPLVRFFPGSRVLSVGSYGCNLSCPWCQNASIACADSDDIDWQRRSPEELVELACKMRTQGNIGIAFTYNEPLIGFEFVYDTAILAHEAGLKVVLVSNGQIIDEALKKLLPLIDAANIDLKAFSHQTYERIGGSLDATLGCIESMAECVTCHLEVTTLVIPGINDTEAEIDEAALWLAGLDADIPYHISRFFPAHEMMHAEPTPVECVYRLADVARQHLRFVYTGNC